MSRWCCAGGRDWRYHQIGTLMTHLLLIPILIKRCQPAQEHGYSHPAAGLNTGQVNTTLASCLLTQAALYFRGCVKKGQNLMEKLLKKVKNPK